MAVAHHPLLPTPQELVGRHRTFGPYGPVYEISRVLRESEDGEAELLLTVLETGEQVTTLYSNVFKDPEAA